MTPPDALETSKPSVDFIGRLVTNTTKFVQSIGGDKSPFPIPKTLSTFPLIAQRNAFHRRDARLQSKSFARWNPRIPTGAQFI
jgi:hypothetical protein